VTQDEIWVLGGVQNLITTNYTNVVEVISTTTWTVRTAISAAGYRADEISATNGRTESKEAIFGGGCGFTSTSYYCTPANALNQVWRYPTGSTTAPSTNVALNAARNDAAQTTMMVNGHLLSVFAGGSGAAGSALNTIEIYNHTSQTVGAGPTLMTARQRAMATSIGPLLFIIGGYATGSSSLHSVEVFNLSLSNSGIALPVVNLQLGHEYHAVGVLGHHVFIAGGAQTTQPTTSNAVEVIDTRDWSVYYAEPLSTPRGAGVQNNAGASTAFSVIFAGGTIGNGTSNNSAAIDWYTCGNYILDALYEQCDNINLFCRNCTCINGSIPCSPNNCCSPPSISTSPPVTTTLVSTSIAISLVSTGIPAPRSSPVVAIVSASVPVSTFFASVMLCCIFSGT